MRTVPALMMVCPAMQVFAALMFLQSQHRMAGLLALDGTGSAFKGLGSLPGGRLDETLLFGLVKTCGFAAGSAGNAVALVAARLYPPSLPLMRDCSRPASVLGPVDAPPCSLHLPLRAVSRRLHGVPARVLAPHGVGAALALLGNGGLTVVAPCLHGVGGVVVVMVLRFAKVLLRVPQRDCSGQALANFNA